MRCAARTLLIVALSYAALSASASVGLLLLGGIDGFLLDAGKLLGGVFVVIMGLFGFAKAYNALLVEPLLGKMEAQQVRMIENGLTRLSDAFRSLMEEHVLAEAPHPRASEKLHSSLEETDRRILAELETLRKQRRADASRLEALVAAHNASVENQNRVLGAIACLGQRDPHASPFGRRKDDPPEADATDLRGHACPPPEIVSPPTEEP